MFLAAFALLWIYVNTGDRSFDNDGKTYFARVNNDDVAVRFAGNGRLIIYTRRDGSPEETFGKCTKTEYLFEGLRWKTLFGIFCFPEERMTSLKMTEFGRSGATLVLRCHSSFGYDSDMNEIDMSSVLNTYGKTNVVFFGEFMEFGGDTYETAEKLPDRMERTIEFLDGFSGR